jgi:hypothetical protein
MQNFLFEANLFIRSGESAARSALDAEDGWDMMQDTTFRRNICRDNPGSNSLLCCAGQNFIFEENESAIHFYPRTYSVCVRNNNILTGDYSCDGRTRSGYARFTNNRYRKGLTVQNSDVLERGSWDFAFNDMNFGEPTTNDNFFVVMVDECGFDNTFFFSFRDGLRIGSASHHKIQGSQYDTFTSTCFSSDN